MDTSTLKEVQVAAAHRLLGRLDDLGLWPECAAWIRPQTSPRWHIVIGTGAVDAVGRSKLYEALIRLFQAEDFGEILSLDYLSLASMHHPLYGALQNSSWTNNDIQQLHIGTDKIPAWVYRAKPTPKPDVLRRQGNTFVSRASES